MPNNNNKPNFRTRSSNAIKGIIGFYSTAYWIAGIIDTFALTEATVLDFTWGGVIGGPLLAAFGAYCDYKVHLTQDTQNQEDQTPISEEMPVNTTLSFKRQLHLIGASFTDAAALAGGAMQIINNIYFRATHQSLKSPYGLVTLLATFGIGLWGTAGEYQTHKISQLRAQANSDRELQEPLLNNSP